jgi:hypothetical protein
VKVDVATRLLSYTMQHPRISQTSEKSSGNAVGVSRPAEGRPSPTSAQIGRVKCILLTICTTIQTLFSIRAIERKFFGSKMRDF